MYKLLFVFSTITIKYYIYYFNSFKKFPNLDTYLNFPIAGGNVARYRPGPIGR